MKIRFHKYQGTGNDFILIDDRANSVSLSSEQIINLCDRRFGIGADGIILLRSALSYDFEMVYYNSDGNISTMCGNGGRCISSFARHLGIINNRVSFLAVDGPHTAEFLNTDPDVVKLKMSDVTLIEKKSGGWFVDTGSPHLVLKAEDLDAMDVKAVGASIRNNDLFKSGGVNVNFAKFSTDSISVRTYERGVEDETLSCGTGVTATALVGFYLNLLGPNQEIAKVNTPGGTLYVHAKKSGDSFSDVWLQGPATFVFTGEINV